MRYTVVMLAVLIPTAAAANTLCSSRQIHTLFPQLLQLSHFCTIKSISDWNFQQSVANLRSLSSRYSTYHHRLSSIRSPVTITTRTASKKAHSTFTYKGVTFTVPDTGNLQTAYPPSYYCNMSSKHLATGSQCPSLQEGKLRIYSMRFCPYAQRAVLVAIAKGIPHDVVNCNLKDKPEFLLERNPSGKVPTIERADGSILYESLVVADYLDEAYANRPLNSSDSFQKALDRVWVENFNKVITQYYKILFSAGDKDAQDTHMKEFVASLTLLEKELERRNTIFYGGDKEPGMLDYMIWPWFERAPLLKVLFPNLYDYESGKQEHPRLEAWRQAMKEDPAVKQFYLNTELHLKFVQSYIEGSPNYDILEESGGKL